MNNVAERQVAGLSTLLQLEKEVRHTTNLKEFGFVLTNETNRLLPYRQAIFWRYYPSGDIRIESISSVAQIDYNAPFIVWIEKLIKHHNKTDRNRKIHTLTAYSFPEHLQKDWAEWSAAHVLWCPLLSPEGDLLGGVWLSRDTKWEDSEVGLSEWLSDAYGHSMQSILKREKINVPFYRRPVRKKVAYGILAAIFIIFLLPIKQTALSPAEVVPKAPLIVASPTNGVIEKFFVRPNETVSSSQPLLSLDETDIKNQHEIALKSLAVSKAEFRKATSKAFTDAESRAQANILKAQVSLREAEVEYAADLLDRIHIKSTSNGIAIFDDPNEWIGKPVVVGEKILQIADPKKVELQLWLPIDDAINLDPGSRVRVFFNVDPLHPHEAELKYASYEAQLTPDNTLAYRLKAEFVEDVSDIRIGLKGTAKVYGERVSLFYFLMRKPLSAVRRFLGL